MVKAQKPALAGTSKKTKKRNLLGDPARDRFTGDINQAEKNVACNAYPYIITYTLKENIKSLHFKAAPDSNAPDLTVVPVDTPLVKIKTINDKWINAAVYDEAKPGLAGETGGYIRLDKLEPVN